MRRCGEISVCSHPGIGSTSQSLYHRIEIPGAVPSVNLRDQFWQFIGVTLGKASEYNDLTYLSLFLSFDRFKYSLDRLLLSITDESASIQQKHINRLINTFRYNFICTGHLRKNMFCIHLVLGTAECDSLKSHHFRRHLYSCSASSSGFTKSSEAYFLRALYHSTTFFI